MFELTQGHLHVRVKTAILALSPEQLLTILKVCLFRYDGIARRMRWTFIQTEPYDSSDDLYCDHHHCQDFTSSLIPSHFCHHLLQAAIAHRWYLLHCLVSHLCSDDSLPI